MSECPSISCCEDNPFQTPISQAAASYSNTRQCATVQCPDLSDSATACVEAGTVTSTVSQADANALALAQAEALAEAELNCAFTSTQQVCVDCPTSGVGALLIPAMTGLATPSGTVTSANLAVGNAWNAFTRVEGTTTTFNTGVSPVYTGMLFYEFASPVAAIAWSLSGLTVPGTFKLFGYSGGTWIQVDAQEILNPIAQGDPTIFTLSAAASYAKWAFYFWPYDWQHQSTFEIDQLALFGSAVTQVCESATRTSLISQQDADNKAYAAALALAAAGCSDTGTENSTVVTLPWDAWNEAAYAAASPYPSIINIAQAGSITKVRLTLHDLGPSANGNSWQMFLQSPAGTTVVFWSDRNNAGVTTLITGTVDVTFDDAAVQTIPPGPYDLASGTFKPSTDGLPPAITVPAPAPQSGYAYLLSAFNGESPTGAWKLWVCSRLTQVVTIAGGWSLDISST